MMARRFVASSTDDATPGHPTAPDAARVDDALRREALERLALQTEEALLLSTADAEGRQRVVVASGAVTAVLGTSIEAAAGVEPWVLLDPGGRALSATTALADAVAADGVATATIEAPGDAARRLAVRVTREGRWWTWRAHDVTAVHARDAELEQVVCLEAMGSLTGELAHDLNNLLMIVQGAVGAARARARGDEVLDACLEEAQIAAGRGHDLAARVLAAHHPGSGDDRELLDLSELVGGLVPLLRRLAGPDVEVVLDLHAPGPRVHADPRDIEQVLLNLVANARDAMAGAGRLRIAVERTEEDVRLLVEDDGTGMDAETLRRATDRFYTTKARGDGTGLGLWSARTALERQGGRLGLHSVVDEGTTVVVALPHPPRQVIGPPGGMRPFSGGGPVLIVDDDPALRWLIGSGLRLAGFDVHEHDGDGDLEDLAAAGPYGVLLCDRRLGARDGVEVVRRLRANQPELPVVCTTGYGELGAALAELRPRVRLLRKPFDVEDLVRTVHDAVVVPAA